MARSSPLVSQHLERISGTALARYQKVIRDYVRHRHGIYALYRRDRLYYVGLARNLRSRLGHHLKDKHRSKWDRFSVYLTIGDSHLRELESLVLRIVRSSGNSQIGKFPKAEDLRRTLARALKAYYKAEVDKLLDRIRGERDENGGERSASVNGRSAIGFGKRYKLKARYKGKWYTARLRRDGRIRFAGKTYDSPSAAGRAVRKRGTNGWWFWMYERAHGDWVRLKELRRR